MILRIRASRQQYQQCDQQLRECTTHVQAAHASMRRLRDHTQCGLRGRTTSCSTFSECGEPSEAGSSSTCLRVARLAEDKSNYSQSLVGVERSVHKHNTMQLQVQNHVKNQTSDKETN